MELNELPYYDKIPPAILATIEAKYLEIMKSKLYDRPYDALCWLEDYYQEVIDKRVDNGTFSYQDEDDSTLILHRTYTKMLAIDTLTYERIANWDGWIDKIVDTPKVTADDIKNLRNLPEATIRELF